MALIVRLLIVLLRLSSEVQAESCWLCSILLEHNKHMATCVSLSSRLAGDWPRQVITTDQTG